MNNAARSMAEQAKIIQQQITNGDKEDRTGDLVERYIHYYAPKMGTTVEAVKEAMKDL